jgi:NADH dehydrogenase [ubiquinone] 1 alpha subcomplex assembly factor 7
VAGSVQERIDARAAKTGGISFRAFMDEALYGDGGYYMRPRKKTGTGPDADFATSPTMHPFFGEAIGRQLRTLWENEGQPDPFLVCEFGGGEGDLARNAMTFLHSAGVPVQWTHIERSPYHRELQGDIRSATECKAAHVVVAHEFLDALPFRWLVDGQEMHKVDGSWQCLPASTAVPDHPGEYALMAEIPTWLKSLPKCTVLVVDYGDRFEKLARLDVVRGYRSHQHANPLENPGDVDITASVDFSYVAQHAEELSFETQEEFLIRNGAFEAISRHPQETLDDMSDFMRLKQLILPTGFGNFKVATYRIQ